MDTGSGTVFTSLKLCPVVFKEKNIAGKIQWNLSTTASLKIEEGGCLRDVAITRVRGVNPYLPKIATPP